jgi:hypothetical protein
MWSSTLVLKLRDVVGAVRCAEKVSLRSSAHPANVLDCVQVGTHWIEFVLRSGRFLIGKEAMSSGQGRFRFPAAHGLGSGLPRSREPAHRPKDARLALKR